MQPPAGQGFMDMPLARPVKNGFHVRDFWAWDAEYASPRVDLMACGAEKGLVVPPLSSQERGPGG